MAQDTTPSASALGAGGVAGLSNGELWADLDELFRQRAALEGRIVKGLGEVGRREAFREGLPETYVRPQGTAVLLAF
jgi:hypothetical protein